MADIKGTLARNLTELRLLSGLTQAELGERLNYSDKTVSKWERGESTPDLAVLVEIADLFGVTLDALVRSDAIEEEAREERKTRTRYNHRAITYICEGCVLFVAILAFILTSLIARQASWQWLYFVYALPILFVVRLVFNSVWFNPRGNYLIISMLMWSVLAAIHITFLYFGIQVALIYLLGVAGQIIIVLWSFIKKPKKH